MRCSKSWPPRGPVSLQLRPTPVVASTAHEETVSRTLMVGWKESLLLCSCAGMLWFSSAKFQIALRAQRVASVYLQKSNISRKISKGCIVSIGEKITEYQNSGVVGRSSAQSSFL